MSLLPQGEEYDFLMEKPYRELLEHAEVIVDAGANIGLFTVLCQNINRCAKYICIEPESSNCILLKKNVKEKSKIYKKALWNKEANLLIDGSDGGDWGFTVKEIDGNCNENAVGAISMLGLMKLEKVSRINILKMDIEGSEYEVFDETAETWIDCIDCLIIEIHDGIRVGCSRRVMENMEQHGFIYCIHNENYVFIKQSGNWIGSREEKK